MTFLTLAIVCLLLFTAYDFYNRRRFRNREDLLVEQHDMLLTLLEQHIDLKERCFEPTYSERMLLDRLRKYETIIRKEVE